MPLSTYTELQTAVATWLARAGDATLTPSVPDFIALCEAQANRALRLRAMETRATASVSSAYVALPPGFLEMRNIQLDTSPVTRLSLLSPEQIDAIYAGSRTGKPRVYAVLNDELQLAPAPDAAYTAEMTYWRRFDPLSAAAPTNWLLTNAPDVYLLGALLEAAPFLGEDERVPLWQARYELAVKRLQESDDRGTWSGSAMQIRGDGGNP